jgi:hypothetical protein
VPSSDRRGDPPLDARARSYWKGKSSTAALSSALAAVDDEAWRAQAAAGVGLVALDGTAYDQVLDMVAALGIAPPRFEVGPHARGGGVWA